jgi:hypothetical protein
MYGVAFAQTWLLALARRGDAPFPSLRSKELDRTFCETSVRGISLSIKFWATLTLIIIDLLCTEYAVSSSRSGGARLRMRKRC